MPSADTIRFPRREIRDPVTGRRWTQLTYGEEFCYPLYFFGPTLTSDGRLLLFHRYRDDEVQNWRMDLATGEAVRLTAATTPSCLWRPWDEPRPACGVRELFSAFSPGSEEMFYFDRNVLRAVHVRTLADRAVYELPADRVPCGLPGASPDGAHLAMVHCDLKWWEGSTRKGAPVRHGARGCRLDVVDTATGRARNLVTMNSWLTHANFLDNERILFCHPPTECAILMTDLRGGWYSHLRAQTVEGWVVNHYLPTERGIMYETVSPMPFGVMGICDPATYVYRDFKTACPMAHLGHDPAGKLWFGDSYRHDPPHDRFLAWFPRLRAGEVNPFTALTRGFQMYGGNQRSHIHAVLLPDRRHILFTGPDDASRTNHLFLLDVSDLAGVETAMENVP